MARAKIAADICKQKRLSKLKEKRGPRHRPLGLRTCFKKMLSQKHIIKDETVLKHHLDTLVDFWDNTLFYSGTYNKNAIKPHIDIHETKGISSLNFDQWLSLFNKAVDNDFTGQNANTIKSRALSIATVMKLKLKVI